MAGDEQDQIRSLAERVARRLAQSESNNASSSSGWKPAGVSDELSALRSGLAEMQSRLARIESRITRDDAPRAEQTQNYSPAESNAGANANYPVTRSPFLSGIYVPATEHPSQHQFGVGEAVSELVDYFEQSKTCTMEPGNKPCDHCSMCNTRGF
jgi:hypothetical protein